MNTVTVITGGTSGIGRAICKKVSENSSKDDGIFVVYGHNDEMAQSLKEEVSGISEAEIVLIKADLSSYDAIGIIKNSILEHTDHINNLILNAGISTYASFDEYTPEMWENIIRTNLNIPVFLVKELKSIIADKGSILFMGSHAGQATYSSSLVYSVSKAGVLFAARSMVKLFDDRGIRVNAIAPGFIETRWQDNRSEESYNIINRKIALHRFGTPEEVAELSYHVLTNTYLNGSIYDVHGGYDFF